MDPEGKKAGLVIRVLCAVIGVASLASLILGLIGDLDSGLTWVHAIKYLAMGFACYLFLAVAIRGEIPSWVDI